MWYHTSFLGNPFANANYSRARKLLYARDQVARLAALDAKSFAVRIQATQQAADQLTTAAADTGAATGQQRGATSTTDTQLQALRKLLGARYNVLLGRLNNDKNAPLLLTVFGASIRPYTTGLTKTNAATRLPTLLQLLAANQAAVGKDIVQDITDAATAYLAQRTAQVQAKGGTDAAHLAESSEEEALDQVLWLNLGAIVAQYPAPGQQPQRHAAADFTLLPPRPVGPAPHTEHGRLAPTATFNLVDSGLKDTTPLRLHNPGLTPLRFGLSDGLSTFPTTGYQEVAPGATLALVAGQLGSPLTHPYLNVQNPSPTADGQYEVRVG